MVSGSLTVAEVFRPVAKRTGLAYDLVLILAGSVLIALSAQLAFWIPFSPVPVTGQTFAILMLGALLGARRAGLCVLAYIAEGLAGLPVFAGGGGGIAWLIGPTGGYLLGFIAAAVLVGYLAEHGWDRKIWTTVLIMLAGNICIYTFGVLWLTFLMIAGRLEIGIVGLFKIGLFPYIVGDVAKTILAALVLPAGWKILNKFSGA